MRWPPSAFILARATLGRLGDGGPRRAYLCPDGDLKQPRDNMAPDG